MLQKHGPEGNYTRLLTQKLQITIKRHPRLPHSQMVVQKSPSDLNIPFHLDNGLVSGFEPSGDPQQMYGSEPKLEVPSTGDMISSDVLPNKVLK